MDEYRQHLAAALPVTAISLFATFSRFEFALKRGGFLLGEINGKASADWNAFADVLGSQFFDAMQAAHQARIFFEEPPRRLDRIGLDEVAFVPVGGINNGQRLFEAIRLVRNNLFHGEKARLDERDLALMQASLFVLDSAMVICDKIDACKRIPAAFAFAAVQNA